MFIALLAIGIVWFFAGLGAAAIVASLVYDEVPD